MEALHKHINRASLMHHWAKTNRVMAGSVLLIVWEVVESAIKALPKAKQQWVSKLASRFLPYGKNMKCWKLHMQAKCPRCLCQEEGQYPSIPNPSWIRTTNIGRYPTDTMDEQSMDVTLACLPAPDQRIDYTCRPMDHPKDLRQG